ncbi:MAG: hypothetical protein M1416_03585 [Candidatus Pacearchaeota archaeon]|nr:hypothetical protein [Candidatus Pacearchaeota archaeon]
MTIEKILDLEKMPKEWKDNIADGCFTMLMQSLEDSLWAINIADDDISNEGYNLCKNNLINLNLWNEEYDLLFSKAKKKELDCNYVHDFILQEKNKYKIIAK